ncbi:MAG TPA: FecR domain-containing protein [Oxalicibacterium sp.]|nr:FecR domain-containing protein [Oxalicibacterium sp.]
MSSVRTLTPLFPAADARHKPAIDRAILEAAADWHVRRQDGVLDAAGQIDFERWLAADDNHRRAWDLACRLGRHLGDMPAELALPALEGAQQRRRTALKALTLLATAGLGWTICETLPWDAWNADYRTAPGEQRAITLADGGTLELNTDTLVDIRYDDARRLIRLRRGEIMIRTAADNRASASHAARRFIVETPQGGICALGTRFSVRSDETQTLVAVYEHAVEITPAAANAAPVRIEAGTQATFSTHDVSVARPVERNRDAWTRGMLVAIDRRMDDFLAELARYRRGHLQCDPAIAAMRITGAYRLDDTDAVLESLAASHPVRVRHFTRYWVQVGPAG